MQKLPLILDTDIGDDVDDALALALILRSPELDRRGTVGVEVSGEKTWGFTVFREHADGPHEICVAVKAAEAVGFFLERVRNERRR